MTEQNHGRKLTRREFLRNVAVGSGTLGLLGLGVRAVGELDKQTIQVGQAPTATPLQEAPPQVLPTETPKPLVSEIGMLFAKGYDTKDTQEYIAQVVKEKENILKNRYEGGGLEQDKDRVNALRGDIDNAVDGMQPPVASFIKKILPGLIFIESRGEKDSHKPNSQAMGLCQITPTVLEDLEKTYPGFTKGKDVQGVSDNIVLGAKYLDHMYKIFPDPALATWAYHIGQTRLSRAMYRYLVYEKKVLTEKDFDKLAPPQTISLVQNFRSELSVPKFMDAVPLAIEINEQYTDHGLRNGALRYVSLIAAGNELLAA